ncbi:MAG: hypothetical protein H0W61_15305 [Bacteroidetes bacterium]|nr:hypothetical protein [Bacteroidota bacterium]
MQHVEFPYGTMSYNGHMVILTIKEGAVFDVAECREMITTATRFAGNKPYVLLSDARVYFSITPEGRKVTADKNEAPLLKANAVIINNLPARLIANFFGKFNKPHFQFKVFTNEQKAVDWLMATGRVCGIN